MDAGSFTSRTFRILSGVLALATLLQAGTDARAGMLLVHKGAGWRYLDDGSNQDTDWRELWYDDDAWGFGHAELGYGDAIDGRPETTVINYGPDPDNRYITTYFRRFFYVADVPSIT